MNTPADTILFIITLARRRNVKDLLGLSSVVMICFRDLFSSSEVVIWESDFWLMAGWRKQATAGPWLQQIHSGLPTA